MFEDNDKRVVSDMLPNFPKLPENTNTYTEPTPKKSPIKEPKKEKLKIKIKSKKPQKSYKKPQTNISSLKDLEREVNSIKDQLESLNLDNLKEEVLEEIKHDGLEIDSESVKEDIMKEVNIQIKEQILKESKLNRERRTKIIDENNLLKQRVKKLELNQQIINTEELNDYLLRLQEELVSIKEDVLSQIRSEQGPGNKDRLYQVEQSIIDLYSRIDSITVYVKKLGNIIGSYSNK